MSHTYMGQTQLRLPISFVSTPSPSQTHVYENQVGNQVHARPRACGYQVKSATRKQK